MEQGRHVQRTKFEELIPNLDEAVEGYNNVKKNVVKELVAIGIQPKQRPKMPEPELKVRISEMTNEELGDFQGECATWEAFLGSQLGIYESHRDALNGKLRRILSRLKNELKDKKVAASNRADMAKDDDRYARIEAELLVAKGAAKGIAERLEGLKNLRKAASRYVEIRVREIDAHTRTSNVQKRRSGAPTFRK
jgi:hypothetical protein